MAARFNPAQGLIGLRRLCKVTDTERVLRNLMDIPLQDLIDSTKLPDRGGNKRSFKLSEHKVPVPPEKLAQMEEHPSANGERILEAKLINLRRRSSEGQDVWHHLVAWQIPLFDKREKKGWGYVDLLGLSTNGSPVVVELKRGNNSGCTPLAALLEALSYALVIAKQWGKLREELRLERSLPDNLPEKVRSNEVGLVILASEDYWKHWQKEKGKFAKSVSDFNELLKNMRDYGFSVQLCCMDLENAPTRIKTREDMPQAGTDKIGYSSW